MYLPGLLEHIPQLQSVFSGYIGLPAQFAALESNKEKVKSILLDLPDLQGCVFLDSTKPDEFWFLIIDYKGSGFDTPFAMNAQGYSATEDSQDTSNAYAGCTVTTDEPHTLTYLPNSTSLGGEVCYPSLEDGMLANAPSAAGDFEPDARTLGSI